MKTGKIGHKIIQLDEVGSTNKYLSDMTGWQPVVHGTVVRAGYQSSGMGHGANTWMSERGKNLLVSVYLEPDFLAAEKQFYLSRIISLAVLDLIRPRCEPVRLKWPNDIYVGDGKIAGILIENTIQGTRIQSSICGIGLNVNQKDFPGDLPNPTSLVLESGIRTDIDLLLEELITHLTRWYDRMKNGNWPEIERAYVEQLYRLGEPTRFRDQQGDFLARIVGISEAGELILETESGDKKRYASREVDYLL